MRFFCFLIAALLLAACQDSEQSLNYTYAPDNFKGVTQEQFQDVLSTSDGLVVLHVYAKGCHHCKDYVPILEGWAEKHPDVVFLSAKVPENSSWAQTESQKGTPTLKIYKNGKLVSLNIGVFEEKKLDTELEKFR